MQDTFPVQCDVTLRHARRDDLRKLEWFGLLTPFREIIERAYTRAEKGEISYLVAELNGFPIGQVCVDFVRLANESRGIIWALRVLEPLQNQRIGTRLIHAAEADMIEQGLRTAEIRVGKDNTRARRLYERLGYYVTGDHLEQWRYTDPDGRKHQIEEQEWILRKALEESR